MAASMTPRPVRVRLRGWRLAGWALTLALGVFPALAAVLDLTSDAGAALPADHASTFTALAGTSFAHAHAVTPGMGVFAAACPA